MTRRAVERAQSGSSVPAYQHIAADIRAKIRDGHLLPGEMLAGRHQLAQAYGVALATLQHAVTDLVAEGVLEVSDRRGTFVARTHVRHPDVEPEGGDRRVDRSAPIGEGSGFAGAQPLVSSAPGTLGIVTTAPMRSVQDDVGTLWTRLAVRSLEEVFAGRGGVVHCIDCFPHAIGDEIYAQEELRARALRDALRELVDQGANALAVVGLCDPYDMSDVIVSTVDVERVPTVCLSWHEIRPPLAHVYYDNRLAGYQAAQHLLRNGYTKLGFLAVTTESWLLERLESATDALRHAGRPASALCVIPQPAPAHRYDHIQTAVAVRSAAQSLLRDFADCGPRGRLALIAPNDHTAFSILDLAADLDLTPGVDFGLIGFDDDTRAYARGLTTVRPPVEDMGREAGWFLLRALCGETISRQIRLPSRVIQRRSTVRLRTPQMPP